MDNRNYDIAKARILRDEGMDRVTPPRDEFPRMARRLLWAWLHGRLARGNQPFIAEDAWQDVLQDIECPPLRHPNQLGATWNAIVRRGWVEATGKYRQPRKTESHARECKLYRAVTHLPTTMPSDL